MTAIARRFARTEAVSAVAFGKKILGIGYFDAQSQIEVNPRYVAAIAFCHERIANFIAPKTVSVCTLPKIATGKIQKFTLRAIAREMGSQP